MKIRYLISRWLKHDGEDWKIVYLLCYNSFNEAIEALRTLEPLALQSAPGITFGACQITSHFVA